ncbi:MAG: hypothetical protein LUC88_09150 [Prevotella sp.]|nr:hypothetical protein [Prevotella sp.]
MLNILKKLNIIIVLNCLILISSIYANAQEIKIKSFSMQMDPMINSMQRQDKNGNICALVKVIIPSEKAVFEGSLIGNCEFKTSEYWCYLTPGSKFLKVKYPDCEPLLVNFENLIGAGVKGSMIYELVLDIPQKSSVNESFNIKGYICLEDGEVYSNAKFDAIYGAKHIIEAEEKVNKIISGIKVYHNFNNGNFKQVFSSTSNYTTIMKEPRILYEFSDVHIGDSITVFDSSGLYNPTSIVISKERLGESDLNILLPKKKWQCKGVLIDEYNKMPLAGVEIYDGPYSKNPICVTDDNGNFVIDNCYIDKVYNLYFKKLPSYYYTTHGEIYGSLMHNTQTVYVSRYNVLNFLEKDGLDVSDITAICDDTGEYAMVKPGYNDNTLCLQYPKRENDIALTVRAKGYKTLRIIGKSNKKLKLEKGNESETVEYVFQNGKLISHKKL